MWFKISMGDGVKFYSTRNHKFNRLIWTTLVVFLFSGYFSANVAQNSSLIQKHSKELISLFKEAWRATEKHKWTDAEQAIKNIRQIDPLYVDPERGSVFYLQSRIYFYKKNIADAFQEISRGLASLKDANIFDPFTIYQYIILSFNFPTTVNEQLITHYYFDLLKKADARRNRKFLKTLYDQCRFILPYSIQRDFEEMLSRKKEGTHPGIILWNYWRKEDPTPATFVNERLIEYFVRLNYVLQNFPAKNKRGFDDRGMIYIKLGPPDRIATAIKKVTARYRPHYVWSYESLVKGLYFPFINFEKGDGYQLVPSIEKALPLNASLAVRRQFYSELGKAVPFFFKRLDEVENIYRDLGYAPGVQNKALDRISELDWEEKRFRERVTPPYVFHALDDVKSLPVHFRTARFLEPDRRTRLELYGGVSKKALWDKSMKNWERGDSVIVALHLSIENSRFTSWQRRSRILAKFEQKEQFKPEFIVFKNVFLIDSSRFYLSGQIEDWWHRPAEEVNEKEIRKTQTFWRNGSSLGKLVKLSTFRSNLIESLPDPDSTLVLSDLVLSNKIETQIDDNGNEKIYVQPFPFENIYRFQPLYVYFEIYGLKVPPDNPARYKIAYTAEVVSENKNILAEITDAIKGTLKHRIETESEYQTFEDHSREWLQLDFSRLVPGKIRFTVTVTDLQSKQSESREVYFQLL